MRSIFTPARALAWAAVGIGLLSGCASGQPEGIPPELLTVAEKSGYKATARHAEVVDLLRALDDASDLAVSVPFGTSVEGRDLPALVIARPPVASADQAREARRRGRLVAVLYGNIHAGEVDGKEALPMLARELILTPDHPLLNDVVVVVVPIYNADGNERVARTNRPGQDGPEEGMGIRENAQGFDLNRDFIKLEAPETRALVRFVNDWDADVIVDTHTTNGSLHRYPITYAGPKCPAGDAPLIELVRDHMLPQISTRLRETKGLETFFYGNFSQDMTRWESFPSQPRYGTTYFGLVNRVSILSEGYSYAPYKDRVVGTLDFCREILEWSAQNKRTIRDTLDAARRRATERGSDPDTRDMVTLRSRLAPAPEKVTMLGFGEPGADGRRPHVEHVVEHWDRDETLLAVPRPYAYVLPADRTDLVENLQFHGVRVDELREDLEIECVASRIVTHDVASRPFQGRHLVTIEAEPVLEARRLAAGSWVVRTAQPLGNLAVVLLEPQGDDGLAAWGFFPGLKPGDDFPVLRLPARTPLLLIEAATRIDPPPEKQRLTFDLVHRSDRRPNLNGSPVGFPRWLDAEHYLQARDGRLRKVHARTGRSEPFHDPDVMARALAALPSVGERQARRFAEQQAFTMTEDLSGALFEHENDLYFCRFDASIARRLTSTPEREETPVLSPDGRFVAFVRSNDLFVVDIETATERALTTGGTDTLRRGKADWVYFEEVFGRSWRTFWWSPDSTRLAFLETDASMVPSFTLVDDRRRQGDAQHVEVARYPKPGQPNPVVRLATVTVAGGEPRWCDLSSHGEHLITGVGWWPDSSALYACVQDRAQKWLDLCRFSADGGAPSTLFRETTGAWVDAPGALQFLKDGSFLFPSERSGWKHLYRYARDGRFMGALTQGEWECRSVLRVCEPEGWVYISGNRDHPLADNAYRVRLDSGEVERLTHEPGAHRASVAPGGGLFVRSWSSIDAPSRVDLRAGDGSLVRTLDTNPVRDLDRLVLPPCEVVEIPAPDGEILRAAIIKPPGFDPAKAYPVWINTYAGPHAPSVGIDWAGGRLGDRLLASVGIIAVRADPRSASGVSAKSAWTAYLRLGQGEIRDLDTVVDWITAHPWADKDRVGIAGFSYGGYMAAYALTHSTRFSAGIAGAPVTDWRDYDTIYTERFMDTPANNPEGYLKGSVVEAARDLHGRLLLVHGAMDDNVHAQNTTRLIDALQRADKDFELMIYPGARHGIGGAHYTRSMHEFILRTMSPR